MINDEQEVEVQEVDLDTTTEEEVEEDAQDSKEYWKAEALKNKAILDRNKGKEKKPASKKSDEFDYGEYAYLAQKGIESDEDIAFVKESMQNSGKSLRDTLGANWFKAELEERQSLATTANAVPKGNKANGTAIDSVEYWATKPIAEVPAEMRTKVVNAKIAKESSGGAFYNS